MNVVWTRMEYENMTQGHLDYGTTMTGQSVCEVYHTDKKEKKIFLIYKEIQSGAVAKSYMRKGFLIYEEMRKIFPHI